MASIITHPLVPVVVAIVGGRARISGRLLIAGMLLSILPDLDVVAFKLHIPYSDPLGHRGFTHSIVAALSCAAVGALFPRVLGSTRAIAFSFLALSMMSHGVLDAFTRQGLGVEFFWPFSHERYFFPFHPVESSPLSVKRFIRVRGGDVLQSELVWIWAPLTILCVLGYGLRRLIERRT